MANKFYELTIKDIKKETSDCVSIALDVPAALKETFTFDAGQYLTFRTVINGEEVRRSYSICTSPEDDELRVAIKRVVSGRFSTFANDDLQVADKIEVMPPEGRFVASTQDTGTKQYLMIAAGSGITPIIALIKSILAREPESSIMLLYGNKSRAAIIFKEQLASLKNQYLDRFSTFHFFSKEQLETPLMQGRLDADKLDQFLRTVQPASNLDEVFICGPEEMTISLRKYLLDMGLSSDQIHVELFGTSAGRTKPAVRLDADDLASASEVTIKVDGATMSFRLHPDGEVLLDAALKQGADLPYACKGGVCTTCKARVESGSVEMDVNYGLEPDEVKAGLILTCQAHPRSESLVVNYDVR